MAGTQPVLLRERAKLERQRLHEFRSLLDEPEVLARLGPGVTATLRQLLQQQQAALGDPASTQMPSWDGFRERRRTVDRVLAECLAVVAGAFTRPIPRISSSCEEAQGLAQELHGLTRVAADHSIIPAETECASLVSTVVRRRFPDHGIWDLPVVAHEYGHLVARDLLDVDPVSGDTSRPLADFLAGRRRQAAELAADVFAVYVLGPAYPLTLVLHRMDPTAGAVSAADATHPGDASRVAAVLHLLGRLSACDIEERRRQYDFLVTTLTAWWSDAQSAAPPSARLTELEAASVTAEADRIWDRIASSRLAGTRYATFPEARALADVLGEARTPGRDEVSCRDALNAAWLARFRAWRVGEQPPDNLAEWTSLQLRRAAAGQREQRHD
ncbi:hypothetical protein ACI78T_13780 [Blastococcus sp. SYSU D00922]